MDADQAIIVKCGDTRLLIFLKPLVAITSAKLRCNRRAVWLSDNDIRFRVAWARVPRPRLPSWEGLTKFFYRYGISLSFVQSWKPLGSVLMRRSKLKYWLRRPPAHPLTNFQMDVRELEDLPLVAQHLKLLFSKSRQVVSSYQKERGQEFIIC